jgi:glycosyltransferase involved in cell wall biosynthesis
MKVALVNTSDTIGGAAVACNRLLHALNSQHVQVNLLVQKKQSNSLLVNSTTNSYFKSKLNFYRFAYERLLFSLKEKSKEVRFAFSLANTGEDISNNTLIKQSDIIHLHWINFGFLSLNSLRKLFALNKPVVWTLHDMWSFTGGCHYCGDCNAYKTECKNCPFLKHPYKNDISNIIWNKKLKLYNNKNITIVTCSKWLAEVARNSSLLKNFRIESIPNPIDISIYQPFGKEALRNSMNLVNNKKYILFGSMNIEDKRKGFYYLSQALEILHQRHPELHEIIELIVFGKSNQSVFSKLPYKTNDLGMLKDENKIVQAYNAADLFILPSLEDNLPNTIMESLSCGTPVVAFNTGGIPEMIDHKSNGYLTDYKNAEDLANGIYWTLFQSENADINARKKVLESYTYEIVAEKYKQLYNDLLK